MPDNNTPQKLWIRFNLIAFDKQSSASFQKSYYATGNESFEKSFKSFREEIPFTNWFYELEVDNEDAYDESTLDQVFGEALLGIN